MAISTDMTEPTEKSSSKTLCDPQSSPRDEREASPEEVGLAEDLEHLGVPPPDAPDKSGCTEDLR